MQSKLIEENYVLKENTVFELSMLPKSLDPDFLYLFIFSGIYIFSEPPPSSMNLTGKTKYTDQT